MLETRDALGNRVTVGERDAAGNLTIPGNDYRVLQPRLMMDPTATAPPSPSMCWAWSWARR